MNPENKDPKQESKAESVPGEAMNPAEERDILSAAFALAGPGGNPVEKLAEVRELREEMKRLLKPISLPPIPKNYAEYVKILGWIGLQLNRGDDRWRQPYSFAYWVEAVGDVRDGKMKRPSRSGKFTVKKSLTDALKSCIKSVQIRQPKEDIEFLHDALEFGKMSHLDMVKFQYLQTKYASSPRYVS